jgi:site-specific DNA-methyltransferase (adenine-specific)
LRVLDPFAGSGSTGIAAHNEGFDYLLIEIDPEYADIAKIRNAQVRLPR